MDADPKTTGIVPGLLSQFPYSHALEWLETNGLGGWSSSTVSGAHARRHHGLLVAPESVDSEPIVLVSKLEESILSGDARYDLGCNHYPGALFPAGHQHLTGFDRDLFPVLTYEVADISVRKTVAAVHGEHTALILYEFSGSDRPFTLELRPMYSARPVHALSVANEIINQQYVFWNGVLRLKNYAATPEIFISVPGSTFREDRHWYYNLIYSSEMQRGMDHREDLYSHGVFCVSLKGGDELGVMLSTAEPQPRRNAFSLFRKEERRRKKLTRDADTARMRRLTLAAGQFIITGRDKGPVVRTGYHWHNASPRDVLISLPGLCLPTARHREARRLLQELAETMGSSRSDGRGRSGWPVDAILWYFVAVYQYYIFTRDATFVRTLLPMLTGVLEGFIKGNLATGHVDEEGMLLTAGPEAADGSPVRSLIVNALWYNALRILEFLFTEAGKGRDPSHYSRRAEQVTENFIRVFWNDDDGCLYNYVKGEIRNAEIRPQQLYTIMLPYPLLPKPRADRVLHVVERELVTPRGLRSLSPADPLYAPAGDGTAPSANYGSIWVYWVGAYVDALILLRGSRGRSEALAILDAILEDLDRGCVGTLSEYFDGDAPYTLRGCVAASCAVAEVLRVLSEHNLSHEEAKGQDAIDLHAGRLIRSSGARYGIW